MSDTGTLYSITLPDLELDRDYVYRVISGSATNGGAFRTYPTANNNRPITFAVQGDASLGNFIWGLAVPYRAFRVWQAAYRPDAMLLLGDIASDGESLISNAWQVFFTNGAPLMANCPSYSALGNHECVQKTGLLSPRYNAAFSFPTNGPADHTDHTYSFDCSIAHITVIEMNDGNQHFRTKRNSHG